MLQEKLNELGKLIEHNPASEQILALAKEIKRTYTAPEDKKMIEEFCGSRISKLSTDIENLFNTATKLPLD